MLPIVEHYERGLLTEDELGQEFVEVLSARHLYGIVVTLISDVDVYRNSGEEPTNEQPIVTPPIPKYMRELERLFPVKAEATPVQQKDEPTDCLGGRLTCRGQLLLGQAGTNFYGIWMRLNVFIPRFVLIRSQHS
jgi:hypothetical protein